MLDQSNPLGALLIGVLGAAIFAGLQFAFRHVTRLDPTTPFGAIACVVIGASFALGSAGLLAWLLAHVHLR